MAERETSIWLQLLILIFVAITRDALVQSRGCNNTTQGPYQCKCPCSKHRIEKCFLTDQTNGIETLCKCKKGHQGTYCDQCMNGWYQSSNFSNPDSVCMPCNCSGNLDFSKANICDQQTGKCLNCLPETTGEYCERCADGFHGDAVHARNCTRDGFSVAANVGKHINKEVIIIATCSIIGIVCIVAIIYLIYQRHKSYCMKGRMPKFWTMEITNRNYDDLDFSLLDSIPDTPFVYRNDTKDFEEALITDNSQKSQLRIDLDSFTEDFEDTSF